MSTNTESRSKKQVRGQYNEILLSSLTVSVNKQVTNLVYAAANAEKIDEHGSWEFGAEFDKKGRGSALNWDLYGVSRDYFSRKTLIVVQVRQYIKRWKNYWPEIKKSYFLLGRNEDDTVFAHAVSGHVVQAAARADKDVVRACQNWIFGVDYTRVIRQGDCCLIPLLSKAVLAHATEHSAQFTLQESHEITAEQAVTNGGHVYVLNPNLTHTPGTHPNFHGLRGWYKVVMGRRSDFYDFAAPTID